MPYNTKGQKHDADSWKVNQYFNPTVDQYEVIEGAQGALLEPELKFRFWSD